MFALFQYDFMIRAFLAGVVIAVIAPMIGIFLVIRRYSFLADTLAHVSLAGVTIGYLTNTQPILTAILASTIAALAIEELRSWRKVLGESALALFLSGGLALAAVLLSAAKGINVNLSSVLFGSITTVSPSDVYLILGLGIVVVLTIGVLFKEFYAISFDEELAIASGLRVKLTNRILIILAAVTVALTMRIVGVLLVGALMVIPVIAAMQWQRSFLQTLIISVTLSLFSVVTGLVASYYLGFASGGMIVLVAICTFIFSILGKSFTPFSSRFFS